MKKKKENIDKNKFTDFRKVAEEKTNLLSSQLEEMEISDLKKLLFELEVHKLELEMQNDELLAAQLNLKEINEKYFDLYNFAPIGYLTLYKDGKIEDINNAACVLLGQDKNKLVNRKISEFILKEDLEIYNLAVKSLLNTKIKQQTELRIKRKDGKIFWADIITTISSNEDGTNLYRIIISDISEKKNAERLIKRNALLKSVEKATKIGGWEYDISTQEVFWTEETYLIHDIPFNELSLGEVDFVEKSIACYSNEDNLKIREAFYNCLNNGVSYELVCRFTSLKGRNLWIRTLGKAITEDGKPVKIIGIIEDITEKKQNELIAQTRLNLLNFSFNNSMDLFLQKTLDEAEILTKSKIGFFHFVEEDQVTLSLQTWSTNTISYMCNAVGKGTHYNIDLAGVWVDCVQQKKAVIHNNYDTLSHKKGLPEGHAKVIREVVIPIFRNNIIVAIVGVGNKETDYDNNDVELMTKLADFAWDITERKRLVNLLEDSESKYKTLFNSANETISIMQDGIIKITNPNFYNLTGYALEEISNFNPFEIIHPDDREMVMNYITKRMNGEITDNEYTFRLIDKNNNLKWVNRKLSNINWDGRPAQLIIDNDITEIKKNEEKIKLLHEQESQKITELNAKNLDLQRARISTLNILDDLSVENEERRKAEQLLKASELKFRTMSDYTFDMEYWEDENNHIVYISPSCQRITGYTREEILANSSLLIEIVHPDDKEMLEKHHDESYLRENDENVFSLEFRIINKNNTLIYLEHICRPIFDDSNKFIGRRVSNRDISERIIAGKALKESEMRYRILADNSPMPVIAVSLVDGNLLFANKSAYKLMGAVQEVKSIKEFFVKDFYAEPQKRVEFLEKLKNDGRVSGFEVDVKTMDGEILTVIVSAIIATFENEQAIFTSFYDISDRKKAEASLRESELRFQHVTKATGDWIWELDKNGLYTYSSDACFIMLGYTPDEIVGKKYFYDFFENEKKEELKNFAFSLMAKKETFSNVNNLVLHKNGSKVYLTTSAIPIFDNNKNLIGYRGADKNISKQKQAELALRESEAKFRSIVTNTEEILFMLDNNGIFTLSEGKGLVKLGLKPGQIVGLSAYDIYKDLPEVIKGIKMALLGGNVFLDKIKVGNVYFNVWYSPNKNENDDILGLIGMAVNITEQVNAEKALSNSEEKFRNIFENHSAIKLLIDPENGNIVDANKSASEFYGWSIDELKAMKIFQINTLSTEATKQEMNEVINKTKGIFKFKHRLANGDIRDIESYSSLIKIGEESFLYSIIHDVTERRKVEIELQKRSLAIEQSSASIVITDLNGNIEYVNPKFTKVTGYSFQEVLGQNPRVLKSGEQPNEFYKELWDTILLGENWSGVFHNQKKNGELFWESAIISPVKNDDGKTINFVAIKEDITEEVEKDIELKKYRENLEELVALRTKELDVLNKELVSQLEKGKQLEIQLAESLSKEKEINELKTKFIATVSHEFRTPLAALFSSTQMIQRYSQNWSEEKLNTHYDRIDSTVKYLTQLLDDVLTISRADREILTNNPESLNIESFINAIFEQLQTELTEHHKLLFTNKLNKETINIDKKLLNHILLNLLTNAIKFSPNGGNIELTIFSDDNNIKISVADNGLGISEDEIKHIFDAFYRAKNSIGINGSGLGLNIIQRSLDVLGGNISVESKVNEGTTFIVKIPFL